MPPLRIWGLVYACGLALSCGEANQSFPGIRVEENSDYNLSFFEPQDRNSAIQFKYTVTRKHLSPNSVTIGFTSAQTAAQKAQIKGHKLSQSKRASVDQVVAINKSAENILTVTATGLEP